MSGRVSRACVAAIAAIALVGCGTLDTYRWPIDRPAPPSALPAIYWEGSLPATGMQELELVEVVGSGTKAYVEDVVGAMQVEAQRYGANAIVRVKVDCGHGTCHGYGVAVRFVAAPAP